LQYTSWFILLFRSRQTISTIETILKEAEAIPAFLPNIGTLKDALKKGKEWSAKVEAIQV
jgi:histone demethylase JARID1